MVHLHSKRSKIKTLTNQNYRSRYGLWEVRLSRGFSRLPFFQGKPPSPRNRKIRILPGSFRKLKGVFPSLTYFPLHPFFSKYVHFFLRGKPPSRCNRFRYFPVRFAKDSRFFFRHNRTSLNSSSVNCRWQAWTDGPTYE
jgi:hypothetical protein